jgi:hypothetical protein
MMRVALIFLAFLLSPYPQSPSNPAGQTENEKKLDPKLHADVLKMIEASGARQKLQETLKSGVADGRKTLMEKCEKCLPEFGDEWEKRMLERSKADDYLAVYARVYEKYLTDEDVLALIDYQNAKQKSQDAAFPTKLKEKLGPIMPSLMSEIMGGCAEVGAKLGAEIGSEIEKEHPEYMKSQTKTAKQ